MNRIKIGEVGDCEVYAIAKGFDVTFEMSEYEGATNTYDNLVDLADDILIASGELGYFRTKAIAKALLKGEEVNLLEVEKEVLL